METFKDEMFETVIANEPVSVIQFSAAWCGPCKQLLPIMKILSEQYKDKAKFFYADIESDALNLGSICGVRGVPTVIVFKKKTNSENKIHFLKTNKECSKIYKLFEIPQKELLNNTNSWCPYSLSHYDYINLNIKILYQEQ